MDDSSGLEWYFTKKPRTFITIPLLILVSLNIIFHSVMVPLYWIDFFMAHPILFLFFGWEIFGILGGIPIMISVIPVATLPIVWEAEKIWGIFKIVIYIGIIALSGLGAGLATTFNLWILDKFATPRTTIWWSSLWGYDETMN